MVLSFMNSDLKDILGNEIDDTEYSQLFRERLSDKSVKANATKSKVIMGNGDFTVY